jgi:hypothetical protein
MTYPISRLFYELSFPEAINFQVKSGLQPVLRGKEHDFSDDFPIGPALHENSFGAHWPMNRQCRKPGLTE